MNKTQKVHGYTHDKDHDKDHNKAHQKTQEEIEEFLNLQNIKILWNKCLIKTKKKLKMKSVTKILKILKWILFRRN